MNWNQIFSSAIGKKLIMAATGLFLIVFLLVHCYVNAQVFWMDGGVKFNEAAHFMGNNPVIRITELGLFAFLIAHVFQGFVLWFRNKSKRPIKYVVSAGNATSKFYSRMMGILGSLILLFLIIHLADFWAPNRYAQTFGAGEQNLFEKMQHEFSEIGVVIVYVLGCFSLAWHLMHGFYSAFQTLGLATNRYKGMIKTLGIGFAIIVPLIFALMPIGFYFNWIH